ncbi:hypothetical protein BXZ70DRAFT_1031637 [Cristinia sonorae]|uniref:Wax synthase domain-containing protein n=1 Tax=Cristinia sonorae TaxID=1940300 RepID=A0A8K0XNH2_9AGAR|nr:hypothetical protein BXZ70DRAFT_1031637 [Cristinia sonorae]
MQRPVWDDVLYASSKAFRTLVPLAQDRQPVTWQNAVQRHAYFVPFYFLAYLARRKDTYYMRILLLPTNMVARADVLGRRREMLRFRVNTRRPNEGWGDSIARIARWVSQRCLQSSTSKHFPPPALADANELVVALRGIGWKFGKNTYIPPEHRPLQRSSYLKSTFLQGVKNFLVFDFLLSVFREVPGVGTTNGGSIFFHSLPLAQRYLVSTFIVVLAGVFFLAGFAMADAIGALIGVGILRHEPKDWPPLMGNPWAADSLHDFWARQWHQNARRTFLIFGGIPGRMVAGSIGMVMGTFLGSGLFHEASMYLIDRGIDARGILFFILNGVGLVFEWAVYKLTGRKVSGPLGRVWTWVFVLSLGQMLVDSWLVRGLGGSEIIPLWLSPTRLWLFPAIPWLDTTIRPALLRFLR